MLQHGENLDTGLGYNVIFISHNMFFLPNWTILCLYQNQYIFFAIKKKGSNNCSPPTSLHLFTGDTQSLEGWASRGPQWQSHCVPRWETWCFAVLKQMQLLRRDMETCFQFFGFKISLARCSTNKMEPDFLRFLKFREFGCACLSDTYWECACFPEQISKHQFLTLTRIVNVESFQRKKSWGVAPNKNRHERCKSQLGLK